MATQAFSVFRGKVFLSSRSLPQLRKRSKSSGLSHHRIPNEADAARHDSIYDAHGRARARLLECARSGTSAWHANSLLGKRVYERRVPAVVRDGRGCYQRRCGVANEIL